MKLAKKSKVLKVIGNSLKKQFVVVFVCLFVYKYVAGLNNNNKEW